LYEGVEASKEEGPKFMQRLVAKQKARVKDIMTQAGGKKPQKDLQDKT